MLWHFLRLSTNLMLAGISAARLFEPADFNVSHALIKQGVIVSTIPELDALPGPSSDSACSIACNTLRFIYGGKAVDLQGEVSHSNGTGSAGTGFSYWSVLQAEVEPYCTFVPSSTSAVSVLVLLSRLTQCPFAITSGGHAAFAGASNIAGGITVSMQNLDIIHLSEDKKTVSIQPGNTWSTIYTKLANYSLAAIGGRVASIGIGGLTTGGGISFFSNIYGWACDNVASYDVVTASGIIITATPTQHSDLYWALRGGGNNLGIVVNFTLETIPLPGAEMWGGDRVYLEDTFPALIEAFTNLVADSPEDPNAGVWVAWGISQGTKVSSTTFWYKEPNGQNATIFDKFNNITSLSDTTQNRILPEWTKVLDVPNPSGSRECYYALTIQASLEVAQAAAAIWFDEVEAVLNLEGILPAMVWQGITTGVLNAMTKNGGNPLGLSAKDGPFYIIEISCMWSNEEDDTAIYEMISTVLTNIKAEAISHGVQNDYVYMNYGSQFQDVIKSYGPDNKAKLKSIASKYDPKQVFQTLQPGYFKLDRAPVANSTYFNF